MAAIDIMNEKLNELKARKEQQEFPGILETIWCDVSFEEELNKAFEQIETRMKGVDIMVNNAGYCEYSRVIGNDIIFIFTQNITDKIRFKDFSYLNKCYIYICFFLYVYIDNNFLSITNCENIIHWNLLARGSWF